MLRAARRWLAGFTVAHLWRPRPGERIVAMTSHMGNLYIATDDGVYVVKHDNLWS